MSIPLRTEWPGEEECPAQWMGYGGATSQQRIGWKCNCPPHAEGYRETTVSRGGSMVVY